MYFSSESSDSGMVAAMQATIDKVLIVDGYKGGIYRDLTNGNTLPLDSLNLLLASNSVTKEGETKAFRPWKVALVRFYAIDPARMDTIQMLMLTMHLPD